MLLFADFETYWAKDYTLRKMTPAEYILDPRFQVHGCAFQWANGDPFWIDGHRLEDFVEGIPTNTVMVTFNALFDMCIFAWRYGYVPQFMVDAMGMARACIGPHRLKSFSLDSVGLHLGFGGKDFGGAALMNTCGMRTEDIPLPLLMRLIDYAKQDVTLTKRIYDRLKPQFPDREVRFMDLVLRCAVTPTLQLDLGLLNTHLADIQQHKQALLDRCGALKPALMSTIQFKALLEEQGVEVEQKKSPTGNLIPALAKTDQFMADLLEHENQQVQALAAARLGHKSTIEETRCQRLINIALLAPTPHYCASSAPIPLRYNAAHTTRLGGEWKINMQNLPRGSKMRKAIKAPPGHKVVAADSAQIEARLGAWFSGEQKLLSQFATGQDPYAVLGGYVFGIPNITKATHPVERFIGKTGILGLGYGAGPPKFEKMVNTLSRVELKRDLGFTLEQSQTAVQTYRKLYSAIPQRWRNLDNLALPALYNGDTIVYPGVQIKGGDIVLPNGLRIHYRVIPHESSWATLDQYGNPIKLYGAKLMENIVQALARVVISDAALLLDAQGLRFRMQAHDELVFVVPDEEVEWATETISKIMRIPPAWAPELPLGVEVHSGPSYGECK